MATPTPPHNPTPDPRALNRDLCDAASEGDAARVASLLAAGADPRGCFDPAQARRQSDALEDALRRTREEDPDRLSFLPDDVRTGMSARIDAMFAELAARSAAAPMSFEIPLFAAVESGDARCIRLILDAGANPLARDNASRTAMYTAATAETATLLRDAGVPVEDQDQFGWSPLTAAVSDGRDALPRVRALLVVGADVNATHDRGYTVFMTACGSSERDPEVLHTLIAAGADPHAVSDIGYNAFHAAIDVNGGANAEESVRATFSFLKGLGVDLEHRNHAGQTPLARAIEAGTGVEVEVLCALGADPNAPTQVHRCGEDACARVDAPPLFHAVLGSGVHRDRKAEALLHAGADPLALDAEGLTPLDHAVSRLCEGATDLPRQHARFLAGWEDLERDLPPDAASRAAFADAARPAARGFVERFASDIPIPRLCEFDALWRAERINLVAALAVHALWARRHDRPPNAAP